MKRKCEVKCHLSCNGQVVRLVRGPLKSDPIFYCCIGCRAYLNRQGLKLKDHHEAAHNRATKP